MFIPMLITYWCMLFNLCLSLKRINLRSNHHFWYIVRYLVKFHYNLDKQITMRNGTRSTERKSKKLKSFYNEYMNVSYNICEIKSTTICPCLFVCLFVCLCVCWLVGVFVCLFVCLFCILYEYKYDIRGKISWRRAILTHRSLRRSAL